MEQKLKHPHQQFKICVSGAAETGHCGPDAMEQAKELGRQIIKQGGVLVTGATTGFPLWAAMGAKEVGGLSIGMSPASSEREHVEVYGLPLDYLDLIIYTGFGFSGRNLLLTRSSDAVLIGCGRVGTINEFSIAFEDEKLCGILDGSWPTGQLLRDIMEKGNRHSERVIFDKDPASLVARIVATLNQEKVKEYKSYKNPGPSAETCAPDQIL